MFTAALGNLLALAGAALATILCGYGSAYGVHICGKTAAGVLSEKPDLFGKLLVIQALPGTQGIYGFLVAFLILLNGGFLAGTAELTVSQGIQFFAAALPITINGLISALLQSKVACSAILMTAKQPGASGKGITMTALVETYAILALLISILALFSVAV